MRPSFSELFEKTGQKLREGAAHFNAARWWEAHEVWEDAWREESGEVRLLLQALIQLAAAHHKAFRMGNPRAAAKLFEKARVKFDALATEGALLGGIDVATLAAAADALGELARRGAITEQQAVQVRIV